MAKEIDKFWLKKSLKDMNSVEWESLCDGCGKCCLEKLEDEDTGDIYTSCVSCRLLDPETCRCVKYEERFKYMDDCIKLNQQNVYSIKWLPKTCSYRLVMEGKDLPEWHPLISGEADSAITSGNSVKEFVVHPAQMAEGTNIVDYIIEED